MRKTFIILVAGALAASCASRSTYDRVRQMHINHVDATKVPDGTYKGEYAYTYHNFQVEVAVKGGRIQKVELLTERAYESSSMAASVLDRIVQRQTPSVDAVSGATVTSKALMKATENALRAGLRAR